MRFNDDLNALTWQSVIEEQQEQAEKPLDRMRKYLSAKYPNSDFSRYFWLSDLYTVEVNLEFSEPSKRRYFRTLKYGHAKICPIYKFINQPILF